MHIEGSAERFSASENDANFHSRPLQSRLGAIASAQSSEIADREALEAKYLQAKVQYGDHPPRPEHWGGYRLALDAIEFWQRRPSRLHDRILYKLQKDGGWQHHRLQP